MKADLLIEEFSRLGARGRDGLLLGPADALALVGRAAEEGVPIVGVNGVRADRDRTPSPPGHLADFSAAVAEGHGCWAEADAVIRRERDGSLLFELTLGDDPLEAV